MSTPYRQLQIRRGLKANLPIGADGELLFCEDTSELFIGNNSNANVKPNLDYEPATPSNWNGSAPTTYKSAIDRIASAVATLLGGPIP